MCQHRPWSSLLIVVAYGLIAVVSLASFATAADLTITDDSPQLIFSDNGLTPYLWEIFPDDFAFDIQDLTASKVPFRIKPGAPDFSLFVATSGWIGLGTDLPLTTLHIKTTDDFPTLRLETSSPVPQIWDLEAGSEGFGLRDVTSGGNYPISVETGAPHNTLHLTSLGNVGFGTPSPTAAVHVRKAAQASTAEVLARFVTSDDAIGSLVISNNSAGDGLFIPKMTGRSASQNAALVNEALITNDVGASPAIVYNAARIAGGALVTRPLVVYRNNSVAKATIAANGDITATSFNPSSSRSIKHNIKDLDSRKAAVALRQLTPVEFIYNDDESAEGRVGFIAEDVPDLVANADRKSVPIMDVVALVTRVVKDQDRLNEQQQQTIDQQQKTIGQQQTTITELLNRLEALETQASATK